jgi:hypothetical protein
MNAENKSNVTAIPASEPEIVIEGYDRIPPNEYMAKYCRHELIYRKGLGHRLLIWFVVVHGDYQGMEIPRFYVVQKTTNGFTCRKGSKFYRDITRLTGDMGKRRDRITPRVLQNMTFLVDIEDVKTRRDGAEYERDEWYSKVSGLRALA